MPMVCVMCLHPVVLNDGVICHHEVPQCLLCELFDTSELSVSAEVLSQLWDVLIVQLEQGLPHSCTDVTVECKLNSWAHLCPVLLIVAN